MVDTVDIDFFPGASQLAAFIANMWNEWDGYRSQWVSEKEELRNYIFATDTTKTTNSQLPWKNKTTIPKLTQIRDNLHANYMAAMFPNEDWLQWSGEDEESVTKEKRDAIRAYMKNKLRLGEFEDIATELALDYIDYGNAFGMVYYENKEKRLSETEGGEGEEVSIFTGAKVKRISPLDIVFNPSASSFGVSPKLVRTVKTIGELVRDLEDRPDLDYDPEIVKKILDNRAGFSPSSKAESAKSSEYKMAGFSSLENYYGSGYIEIIEFYGDIYDMETQQLLRDQIITIVDRNYILRKKSNPSWNGEVPIYRVGWRDRPDNLWSMGPLDNLVGMQYRIDHLENLKADVYDMIAHPMLKIKGDVADFEYEPGGRIYVGDEGDVEYLTPDTTALQADLQIAQLEQKMEELAGAPKQALGIRTPGEKTAYEVQQLENASGRVFQNKSVKFEKFLGKIINCMFEYNVRHMNAEDVIKVIDDDFGVAEFLTISRDDVTAKGFLYPIGARHFAAKAKLIQEISAFYASPIGQDPSVNVHISGFEMAKLFEDVLDIEKYRLVQKNVRILENMDTQRTAQVAQEEADVAASMPVSIDEELPPEEALPQGQAGLGL